MSPLTSSVAQWAVVLLGTALYTLYLSEIGRRRRILCIWTVLVGIMCGVPMAYLCGVMPLRGLAGSAAFSAVWPSVLVSPLPAMLGLLWAWFIPAYDAVPLTGWERLLRAVWPLLRTILLLPWNLLSELTTPRGVRPRDWWGDTGAGTLVDGWDQTLSSHTVPGTPADAAAADPPMSVCPFCGTHNYARLTACVNCGKTLPPRPDLDAAGVGNEERDQVD